MSRFIGYKGYEALCLRSLLATQQQQLLKLHKTSVFHACTDTTAMIYDFEQGYKLYN